MIFDDESKIVKNSNELKAFKIKKLNLDSSKINKGLSNMKKSELNEKTRRIERMVDVDIQKIEKYIAVEILKGIVKLLSYKDYWSKDASIDKFNKLNYDGKYVLFNQLMYSSWKKRCFRTWKNFKIQLYILWIIQENIIILAHI